MAVLHALKNLRTYLLGRKFLLVSDHEPLSWMHNQKDPTKRMLRWMLRFAEYEYDFKYKPGKLNINADALSRNPVDRPIPEDEINATLGMIRVLVIEEKDNRDRKNLPCKDKAKSTTEKKGPSPSSSGNFQDPGSAHRNVPLERHVRAHSEGETEKPRRGRPPGSRTNKEPRHSDASAISQRTRSKSTSQANRGSSVPPLGITPIPENTQESARTMTKESGPTTPLTESPLPRGTPHGEPTFSDNGTPMVDMKESSLRDETTEDVST